MGLDEADETSMAVKEMYKENNGEIPALGSDSLRLSLIAHSTDVRGGRSNFIFNQCIAVYKSYSVSIWIYFLISTLYFVSGR